MTPDQAEIPPDGARASPSPELLELVQERYGVARLRAMRDLGGAYNLNLLAGSGRERLVIRVYHPWVPPARVAAIQEVRERLRAGSWPVAPLHRTTDGEGLVMLGNRVVEVEGFVRATACMNTWPRFRVSFRLLGELHRAMAAMEVPAPAAHPPWANHVAAEEVAEVAGPAIATIRRGGLAPDALRWLDAAERLADALVEIRRHEGAEVPLQLVHGDFWHNNVLFEGERVVLIVDFDFIGVRPRIDDVALTLFSLQSSNGLRDVSSRRLRRLAELVDLYDEAGSPLTGDERRLLPAAIARHPLTFLRDLAWQVEAGLVEHASAELTGLRGPEWEWALRMLGTRRWREAFRRA